MAASLPSLVVLTGAGISAASGLSTFRDPDGLWEKYDFQALATPEAFARDPELVHEFYNLRRAQLKTVAPNPAHLALAKLERVYETAGEPFLLVSQNVDDLHARAGSRALIAMHGALKKIRCLSCGSSAPCADNIGVETACTACGEVGGMRPDIVWFGEMPHGLDKIEKALCNADLFIAIGTSGNVYPAAGFVALAEASGAETCLFNLDPADNAAQFDRTIIGPATQTVPAFARDLVASAGDDLVDDWDTPK